MLYAAEVAVCSEIYTKHINTVRAECIVLKCQTCFCTKSVGFKRLITNLIETISLVSSFYTIGMAHTVHSVHRTQVAYYCGVSPHACSKNKEPCALSAHIVYDL